MKQPRKQTRDNKELISSYNLDPNNWQVISESKTDLEIISKRSGQRKVLEKKPRRCR